MGAIYPGNRENPRNPCHCLTRTLEGYTFMPEEVSLEGSERGPRSVSGRFPIGLWSAQATPILQPRGQGRMPGRAPVGHVAGPGLCRVRNPRGDDQGVALQAHGKGRPAGRDGRAERRARGSAAGVSA